MAQEIGRNDPCPCGSGKKYKKCHMGSEEESDAVMKALEGKKKGLPRKEIVYAAGAALVIAVVTLVATGYPKWAVGVGGAGLVVLGILWVILDPPPPSSDNKNPSGLNFGG